MNWIILLLFLIPIYSAQEEDDEDFIDFTKTIGDDNQYSDDDIINDEIMSLAMTEVIFNLIID